MLFFASEKYPLEDSFLKYITEVYQYFLSYLLKLKYELRQLENIIQRLRPSGSL